MAGLPLRSACDGVDIQRDGAIVLVNRHGEVEVERRSVEVLRPRRECDEVRARGAGTEAVQTVLGSQADVGAGGVLAGCFARVYFVDNVRVSDRADVLCGYRHIPRDTSEARTG